MNPVQDEIARHAVELLADRKWHDLETVLRQLGVHIPPQFAVRHVERSRRKARPGNPTLPPPARKRQRSTDEIITSGRRAMVLEFLRHPIFEITPGRPGAVGPGGRLPRKLRMVGDPTKLRAMRHDPLVERSNKLEIRVAWLETANHELADTVAKLRKYLVENGHEDAANRLAPDGES
jgi:hypothetical protein